MSSKIELLLCPFCGGTPAKRSSSGDERDGYAEHIYYVCTGCGCTRGASGVSGKGGYADNSKVEEAALAAWNTRVAPVVERQQPFAWFTEDYLTDKSSTTYDELTSARWKDKGWSVQPLFREQPAQVVPFSKGFTTFESGNGKYQIVTSYQNRDDAWSDYEALCKAQTELAELQATIARLTADLASSNADKEAYAQNAIDLRTKLEKVKATSKQLAELDDGTIKDLGERLKGGQGEADAWALVNGGEQIRDMTDRWDVAKHWDGDVRPLYFASQPAPVSVLGLDVFKALEKVRGAPVLTTNQCYDLARELNACLDKVKELNQCTEKHKTVVLPNSYEERMTEMFYRDSVLEALDAAGVSYTVPPVDKGI